jgi:ligand-binding SRPBCC domain-containing protein
MVVVSRSIHIEAPVERVFALMSDPAARSRLNPDAQPIRVEIENGRPLAQGSVCRFRLQVGKRVADYRTRVTEFIPDRRIVSVSDSAIPFEISIETGPEGAGTRLTQTECFEPSEDMLDQVVGDRATQRVLEFIYRLYLAFDTDAALRLKQREEEMLIRRLEEKLDRWLAAIKRHLESGNPPA